MRIEERERPDRGHSAFRIPHSALASRTSAPRRPGFTLVELLVVITIIGILTALLLVGVQQARIAAQRAAITTEINQIDAAIKDLKNSSGSFPPNAQTDAGGPINENTVLTDFKQFMLKAFPQHREHEALIKALVGVATTSEQNIATNLPGGMTAAEAAVFWVGGFSSDPKYPITGSGGPSYLISTLPNGVTDASEADPIDQRSWQLGIKVENLGPRGNDGYFSKNYTRFIDYADPRDPSGNTRRRINMWVLTPGNSPAPYVYFDASRGSGVTAANDVPAATEPVSHNGSEGLQELLDQTKLVYAIKQRKSVGAGYDFANKGQFQVLHAGFDREWLFIDPNSGASLAFPHVVNDGTMAPTETLYPEGPWTAELADTQANFTNGILEGAQE
ncbi:type II secretion system protein [Botrimarina mediterranea]|uniref:Type II secretion system protein G n=1 Tax=Botrimarina mediterranea TaxID=2528022 RepID=A0A518K2X3_9BACT|nr:type II secretion system protein [Botrimarina mediterranea]QDV72156.1 hypothetical protein Spa11_03280 [Botrimarina mediterranea]QDV76698.1 hypothetical protein K2D_02790 [Planctomycetes bacterium K2D]